MSELTEVDVGMSEYLCKTQGFHGILKLRFQDFLVNEIDKSGNIVRLTDLSKKIQKEETKKEDIDLPSCDYSVISETDQEKLKSLSGKDTFVLKVENNKTIRTKVHEAIRNCFLNLDSETVVCENEERNIKVSVVKPGSNKRRRWGEKEKSRYSKFVLYKENIATMDAINLMAKKLHLNRANCFQYAGNKDKRGITVQEMTTTLPLDRIISINRLISTLSIGGFTPTSSQLQLGDLNGNYFSIVLRNVKREEDLMEAGLASFKEHGFINFFGMQRFGTSSVPTYEVGKSLIASDWERAIDLILSNCLKDADPELEKYINNWKVEGNASEALKLLRRRSSFEGYLLQGITRFGGSQLVQCLSRIPRNTRMLYLHSYQSYVWNRVVSRRINELGTSPVVGDLVFSEAECTSDKQCSDEPDVKRTKFENINKEDDNRVPVCVKQLTEKDVDSYKMTDIVMPLPGYDITMPHNAKQWYQECFEKDGVNTNSFQHKVKEYSLPGAYRKVIEKPSDVDWQILKYNDYKTPLTLSDRDILRGKKLENDPDGEFTALNIKFGLPSSSYATVALREISKSDMSAHNQTIIGDKHKLESEELLKSIEEKTD